jgi:hypothetical protein
MPTAVPTLKPLVTSQSDIVSDVASLACVSRVERDNFYPFLESFVFQESPKLIERPTIRASTFRFISRLLIGSVSNARQILNRNNGALRLSRFDDFFADVVVQPSLIALLSSRQPFQDISPSPARGSCAFRNFRLEQSQAHRPIFLLTAAKAACWFFLHPASAGGGKTYPLFLVKLLFIEV